MHLDIGGEGDMVGVCFICPVAYFFVFNFFVHSSPSTTTLVRVNFGQICCRAFFLTTCKLGFDPIFFLHHANIDRIYAFWEYVFQEYWFGSGVIVNGQVQPFIQLGGTFDEDKNAKINNTTDLTPFRKSDSEYWNSDDTRFLVSN